MSKLGRQAAREQIEEIEAGGSQSFDVAVLISISRPALAELEAQDALIASQAAKIAGYQVECHEVEQVLGKALGYPALPAEWDSGGQVGVGDNVPGSLAKEAADKIASQAAEIAALRGACGEAYQLAGAIGAPVAVLDNLSDAASGGPLRHETFLPILDTDCFEIQDRDATIAVKNALIASQAAEITKLELCLEPGKASAIVRAVFDIAEKKCGHNPFSARHGLATIDEYLDRQAGLIQSMREALRRAQVKLAAYVGICKDDKELTGAVLPMVSAALAQVSASPLPEKFDIRDGRNRYAPCPNCGRDSGMGLCSEKREYFVLCSACKFTGPRIPCEKPSAEIDKAAFDAWNAFPRKVSASQAQIEEKTNE